MTRNHLDGKIIPKVQNHWHFTLPGVDGNRSGLSGFEKELEESSITAQAISIHFHIYPFLGF